MTSVCDVCDSLKCWLLHTGWLHHPKQWSVSRGTIDLGPHLKRHSTALYRGMPWFPASLSLLFIHWIQMGGGGGPGNTQTRIYGVESAGGMPAYSTVKSHVEGCMEGGVVTQTKMHKKECQSVRSHSTVDCGGGGRGLLFRWLPVDTSYMYSCSCNTHQRHCCHCLWSIGRSTET